MSFHIVGSSPRLQCGFDVSDRRARINTVMVAVKVNSPSSKLRAQQLNLHLH
jgi:hypothetical protein